MKERSMRPSLLSSAADPEALARLRASAVVFDTIADQVGELAECRAPQRKFAPAELADEVARVLGDAPDAYGTWVYYPWSNRLVHVLDRDAFREVRSSRNRNKITRDEQSRLQAATLGVAGLSVGQATAVTLALEGLGGTLRLADFDTLSLSNLNRLRAGVHELGVNKAVLTARAIWEFDPYVHIELFEAGITDDNIGCFLDGLDLLFEECDDLKMKVRLREEARRRRVPVLMETSDRGLLDVERFDREPDRPLFHGLVGGLRAEQLVGLSNYEKVPVVLSILGATTMSPRLAGSLVDVEVSLRTWPQLASSVALGGAVNTDVARRILLGALSRSGRYFVDLEQIVDDRAEPAASVVVDSPQLHLADAAAPRCAVPPVSHGPLAHDELALLVRFASLAPSGGNAQPWRFVYRAGDGVLEAWLVPERARTYLDFARRASHLAFGALAENLRLAAVVLGREATIAPFPDPSAPELVCAMWIGRRTEAASDRDRLLAAWVTRRATNRNLGTRRAFPAALAAELSGLVADGGCTLALRTDADALEAFGRLHGESERQRIFHPVMHRELLQEIRWTREEAERTRDGIDVATLALTPTDFAGMTVLRRRDVVETMRALDVGEGLGQASVKAMAGASAVGLIRMQGSAPLQYLQAGAVMQRTWLLANARGFALQPMTAFVYVLARVGAEGDDLTAAQRLAFLQTRAALHAIFPAAPGEVDAFAFRLADAGPPRAVALRRSIEALLEIVA